MAETKTVDRYAVVGNPVAHSLSPRIHAAFARQTGETILYEAIELPVDGFASGIDRLRAQGFRGANVTVPFKQEACDLSTELSERASTAGAVNTLIFHERDGIEGDNTDGVGLVRDLKDNLGIELESRNILLLGAGGAARGVLQPLLAESPASLVIANRTVDRAHTLARDFAQLGRLRASAYDDLPAEPYHVVINATAAGLANELPPLAPGLLAETDACYDMMYRLDAETAFVTWSRSQGIERSYDGLGMLIEQAAEAFHRWRGIHPDTATLAAELRANRA